MKSDSSFVSFADGYVKWLRAHVGSELIYLVYTTTLVFDDEDQLLVQRRYDFDWLGLPGGALELGEGLRDGAKREVYEETGLHVKIERLAGVFSHPTYNLLYPNGDQVQQWSVCFVARACRRQLARRWKRDPKSAVDACRGGFTAVSPAYRAMVNAARTAPQGALEPVYSQPMLTPHYPILRRQIGHQRVILPGAMAIVRNEAGEVLSARRNDDHTIDVPGGFSDLGETTTATAVREVREETGLEVEPVRLIGVYSEGMEYTCPNGDQIHAVGVAYECRAVGGTLRADRSEISELAFRPVSALTTQHNPLVIRGAMQLWNDIQHPETWPCIR